MDFDSIKKQIEKYKEEGKSLFSTSSFQTHSVVLLHIISRIDKTIPIFFVNTGYHFPETMEYKDRIIKEFGLDVFNLTPMVPKNLQVDDAGRLLFTSDPDYCCFLNKIQPVSLVLYLHDIWINGIRADQTAFRTSMDIEEPAPQNTIRFHPMLDWTGKMVYDYIKKHDLPMHPLEHKGYVSVGCEPCTRLDLEGGRKGRWYGMNKTECGINTDLVIKENINP
jgi:phosphoadenosine phosphosulfate reductase